MSHQKKVVVIGGGPGGYVAAIRVAQLGAFVTLVEKEYLGGTCLNVGCIPTKAIIHPAEIAASARKGGEYGIHVAIESINWTEVLAYKNSIVKRLTGGVAALLKANGVKVVDGTASFIKPKTIRIEKADGSSEIMEADRFIIATGSIPVMPPISGLKESKLVVDSTGLLNMETLPASLVIIGGGVIGIEFACVMRTLGCRVTIVEALNRLVPTIDGEIAEQLMKYLLTQGIEVNLEHKVTKISDHETYAEITVNTNGTERHIVAEKILCCVGRRANNDSLNCEAGGIKTERGKILVDEYLETAVPGVYAIGDCVGQVMLAHAASAQGEIAAENCLGEHRTNYRPEEVPSCVYSFPEIAGVGFTEEQLKEEKIAYHVGRFPMSGNGRALIANNGEGMVKVLIGDAMGEVLGVHIIGPYATELIGEAVLAIKMECTAEEIIGLIFSHPTVSEAVREAFLASENRAIHMPNKKKG